MSTIIRPAHPDLLKPYTRYYVVSVFSHRPDMYDFKPGDIVETDDYGRVGQQAWIGDAATFVEIPDSASIIRRYEAEKLKPNTSYLCLRSFYPSEALEPGKVYRTTPAGLFDPDQVLGLFTGRHAEWLEVSTPAAPAAPTTERYWRVHPVSAAFLPNWSYRLIMGVENRKYGQVYLNEDCFQPGMVVTTDGAGVTSIEGFGTFFGTLGIWEDMGPAPEREPEPEIIRNYKRDGWDHTPLKPNTTYRFLTTDQKIMAVYNLSPGDTITTDADGRFNVGDDDLILRGDAADWVEVLD